MTKATVTPETLETETSGEVLEVALDLCIPSPKNKERPVDEEFLTSLRDKGQQVIAILRPHPEREGFYEIVDGARRQKGLWEIGRRTWRADVREMDDAEADLIRAIANKHRTGLTWWQEAELIEEYLTAHGDHNIAAVGAALGMKNGQVLRRKQLLTLTPKWRKAITEGGKMEEWTPACFELIAAYPPKAQDDLYAKLHRGWCPDDLEGLRRFLGDHSHVLKLAPWDLSDAVLCPKVGSCAACPHRSGAKPSLFEGADDDFAADDTCLVPSCWQDKADAHLKQKLAELRTEAKEKGTEPPLLITGDWGGDQKKKILGKMEYSECKKSDPGAKPAIFAEGGKKGAEVYVQVGKDRGKKKGDKPAAKEGSGPKKSLKERLAEKDKQRDALALDKFVAYIKKDADDGELLPDARPLLTQYALARGLCIGGRMKDKEEAERIRAYAKRPFTAEELWDVCSDEMARDLESVKFRLHAGKPAADHPTVQLVAWMLSVDFADFRADAVAELPDPKSWATEKEEPKANGKSKAPKAADEFDAADELGGEGDDEADL
jgi:ParB/RepB/Spo0J family partition protein